MLQPVKTTSAAGTAPVSRVMAGARNVADTTRPDVEAARATEATGGEERSPLSNAYSAAAHAGSAGRAGYGATTAEMPAGLLLALNEVQGQGNGAAEESPSMRMKRARAGVGAYQATTAAFAGRPDRAGQQLNESS